MSDPMPSSALLTSHAVSVIRDNSPNPEAFFERFKEESDAVEYYPDGSILAEGGDSFEWLWNQAGAGIMDWGLWQPQSFAGLDQFPGGPRVYSVFYTRSYRESLSELDFSIVCPNDCYHPSKDYDLKKLLISVGFKRSASMKTRRAFNQMMDQWFTSVSQQGMFKEGPVKLVSGEVRFKQRLAQFRIDASKSGQNTLNWLLLCVLNFGHTVSAVTDFIFDQEKSLQVFLGPQGRCL